MNWFSVPICRLYPGLSARSSAVHLLHAHNVWHQGFGLGIELWFSKGIKVIVVFNSLSRYPSSSMTCFFFAQGFLFLPYPLLQAGVPGLL